MVTRRELHQLLDAIPDDAMPDVEVALKTFVDPMRTAHLNAPDEDEPTTMEEDTGAAAAWQEYVDGEYISAEEAKRRLLS